ncbi:MAG TPA: cache domain-containing protein, partial [Candidatus Methylomirabilis sp.]|nr:cache domain-containing protein [Candidatus Methylomirabilis sp.]
MPRPRLHFRTLRIREKLILQFVLVAAITFGVAGLLIIRAARRTLEERILSENSALARAVGALVERRAEQAIRDLGDAALARNIREALQARDIPRLEARLKRVLDTVDLFDAVGALDPDGILLANSPLTTALRGQSFASREYYKAVISSGEPFLSPGFRRAA